MSSMICVSCGSSALETEPSRGETYCTSCGAVVDDVAIVSEITFEESAGGAASRRVGQNVSEGLTGGTGPRGLGPLGIRAPRVSRETTLLNARNRIRIVGTQLRLNHHLLDEALNWYESALIRRLTHGRKNIHVVAACIYITCRLNQTPHMLLDLSDATRVNVYELGKTYLRLSAALHITLPEIDPCLYICRFAEKMNLGDRQKDKDKIHAVEMTALRFVQRMKRDWMHAGRRPSGLCGAALMIAARLHGIHCSVKQIIGVVKVCESTIRKRLDEFRATASSSLTLDEFLTIDLEGEEDPPCFKDARRREEDEKDRRERLLAEGLDPDDITLTSELESQIMAMSQKIDNQLEKSRQKLRGPWAKYAKIDSETTTENDVTEETGNEEGDNSSNTAPQATQMSSIEFLKTILREAVGEEMEEVDEYLSIVEPKQELFGSTGTASEIEPPPPTEKSDSDVAGRTRSSKRQRPNVKTLGVDPQAPSSSASSSKKGHPPPSAADEKKEAETGELDLEGIDDEEIESYIATQEEVVQNAALWFSLNGDYIKLEREREAKRKREEEERAAQEAAGILPKKKKKRVHHNTQKSAKLHSGSEPSASVAEAIEKVISEKKISSKINYDVLKNLTPGPALPALAMPLSPTKTVVKEKTELDEEMSRRANDSDLEGEEDEEEVILPTSSPTRRSIKPRINLTPKSTPVKTRSESSSRGPAAPVVLMLSTDEVVERNVQPALPPDQVHEEEEEEEDVEEDEEEEEHDPAHDMDIAQLLSGHRRTIGDTTGLGEDEDDDY